MKKQNLPSSRDIRKVLGQAIFNPRSPIGPIKIIMDQRNPNYYEMRAAEFITEARNALGENPSPTNQQLEIYHDKLNKAMSLLALARLLRSKSQ